MGRIFVQILLFPFPWFIRKKLLGLFFNFSLEADTYIGFSIVLPRKLIMKKGSKILNFNFINRIDNLQLEEYSKIGSRNWITGVSTTQKKAYTSSSDRKCELSLGKHCRITDRHFIDANGGVYIGGFTTVAGLGTQIISHGINIELSQQETGPVFLGSYCFIGTGSIIVKGSKLPNNSVLAAGSVLAKSFENEFFLYGGVPAKQIKELPEDSEYFKRKSGHVQ